MLVLDVNVLVAAFRDDHPHHESVAPWWTAMLSERARFFAPDLVWVGFVRVVTNRRIFPVPATVEEAGAFVEAVRAQPGYVPADPGDVVSDTLALCRASESAGDLVPDAYISATALALGARVATRDRDFRRFDGLRVLDPGA